MFQSRVFILNILLFSIMFTVSARAQASNLSESRCAAKKLEATGRSLDCRMKVQARAEQKGNGSASAKALRRCSQRLLRDWGEFERKCALDDAGPPLNDVDRLLQSVAETVAFAASSTEPRSLENVALCVGEDVIHNTDAGCEPASDSVRPSWAPPNLAAGAYLGTAKESRQCASQKLKAAGSAGRCFLRAEAKAVRSGKPLDTSRCTRKIDQRFTRLTGVCGSVEEDPGPTSGQVVSLMMNLHSEFSAATLTMAPYIQIAPAVCSGDNVAVVNGECTAVSATGTKNTVVMYNLIPDLQHDGNGNYSSLSYLGQLAASGSQIAKPIDIVSSEVLWLGIAANWPTASSDWKLRVDYLAACKKTKDGCDPNYAARNNHGECTSPKGWTKQSTKVCTEVSIPGTLVSAAYSDSGNKFLPQVATNTCWQGLLSSVTEAGAQIKLSDWWKTGAGNSCFGNETGERQFYDLSGALISNDTVLTYAMAQAWAKAAGIALAEIVNADPNAVGISTDLEPTIKQPHRKVFHTTLAAALNSNSPSKFHTMWLGQETIDLSKADNLAMFKALGKNTSNYLTIAMYDRGSNPPEPITPAMYASIFAAQLGSGTCAATDAKPVAGAWLATPGSPSTDPAGVDKGIVCGSISESAWQPCDPAGYGNPMLPCPGGEGLLARFANNGLSNPIQVGLPFKATTSEWIYRGGDNSSTFGDTTAGEYPQCFRGSSHYKNVGTTASPKIHNKTADSMGDYVTPALEIIHSLRTSQVEAEGNTSIIGIYAYGISPKSYLQETPQPFLDTIGTSVIKPGHIQEICSSGEFPYPKVPYSYGTASDLTNLIDEATWDALIKGNPPQ